MTRWNHNRWLPAILERRSTDEFNAPGYTKAQALAVARVAGITAAKQVDRLVPLCHPLALDHVGVSFGRVGSDTICIETTAQVTARTGVEMEALTAASVAALTLWDMTKGIDAGLRIDGLELVEKTKTPLPRAEEQ